MPESDEMKFDSDHHVGNDKRAISMIDVSSHGMMRSSSRIEKIYKLQQAKAPQYHLFPTYAPPPQESGLTFQLLRGKHVGMIKDPILFMQHRRRSKRLRLTPVEIYFGVTHV